MKTTHSFFAGAAKFGETVGKGIVTGIAGTIAITLSQMIEMQLSKRGSSQAPVIVGGKALGVEPKGQSKLDYAKELKGTGGDMEMENHVSQKADRFGQLMHFGYGTSLGILRGALDLAGLKKWPATLVHFLLVWAIAQIMLPLAKASPPITKWSPGMIASDALHHAVYAAAAGKVYDEMEKAEG